jgi:hypothetical protein
VELDCVPAADSRIAAATAIVPPFRSQSTPIKTRWQTLAGAARSCEETPFG